ncbi:MAG: hypothetical protein WCG04_05130 [Alphaproteobacteria bacterium]
MLISDREKDVGVSLAAKALGLIDVVNPAVPVQIDSNKNLIISPIGFTHILEPFIGVNRQQIAGSSQPMRKLLTNVLMAAKAADQKTEGKEEEEEEEEEKEKGKSFILTQRSFAAYFEDTHETMKFPVDQRFADLQTFNSAVSIDNLVKLIAFWQLFMIQDMHSGNILWTLKSKTELSIVAIDYNLCLDKNTAHSQNPPLNILLQATQPIPQKSRQFIEQMSAHRLGPILSRYHFLTPLNIANMQSIFDGKETIRYVMQASYESGCQKWDKPYNYLGFYQNVNKLCGTQHTIYDPLVIKEYGESWTVFGTRPSNNNDITHHPSIRGYTKVVESDGQGDAGHQVRKSHDWVFLVKNLNDLEAGRFFKSFPFPGYYIWGSGMIPFDMILKHDRNVVKKLEEPIFPAE